MAQEQQTPGERALALIRPLLPDWQPTTQDVLRWIRIAIAVGIVILGVLLILDVVSGIFGMKLWNLLKVLAVPITVGAAVPWLNWLQKKREQDVEDQRAQDEALQAYITQVGTLITEYIELYRREPEALRELDEVDDEYQTVLKDVERMKKLYEEKIKHMPETSTEGDKWWVNKVKYYEKIEDKEAKGEILEKRRETLQEQIGNVDPARSSVRRLVIRAQTLTALERVGVQRKRAIMRILSEAKLLQAEVSPGVVRQNWIIELEDADFGGANLTNMDLSHTSLCSIRFTGTNLYGTTLTGADLSNADLTKEQLDSCKSLEGATMPNGQKYEDWIKGREQTKEDAEKD